MPTFFATNGIRLQIHAGFHHIVTLDGLHLGEGVLSGGTNVLHVGSKANSVFASGGFPTLGGFVVGCQIVVGDAHGQRLALPRLQFACLGKGFQFACRFLESSCWGRHVELHHFLAFNSAGVGDGPKG